MAYSYQASDFLSPRDSYYSISGIKNYISFRRLHAISLFITIKLSISSFTYPPSIWTIKCNRGVTQRATQGHMMRLMKLVDVVGIEKVAEGITTQCDQSNHRWIYNPQNLDGITSEWRRRMHKPFIFMCEGKTKSERWQMKNAWNQTCTHAHTHTHRRLHTNRKGPKRK